jgi:hypothetical protein
MDAARLQSKVFSGYGKSALRIGYQFTQYRPATASNPIAPGNIVTTTLNAAFSPQSQSGFKFDKPSEYKGILWSGLFDGTNTRVGDYLVHSTGTFFIAAQHHLLPILCVQCSSVFNVQRVSPNAPVAGQVAYSGVTASSETTIVTQFPGAVQWQGNARHDMSLIESDMMRRMGWLIFLPIIPGVVIKERDTLIDSQGKRYEVMGVYVSDLGHRVQAELIQP